MIAGKKKNFYSDENHDNIRDPVYKLRPVDMREKFKDVFGRPSSAYNKKVSVMPYRSGVYVLDPSVLELQETDTSQTNLELNISNDKNLSQQSFNKSPALKPHPYQPNLMQTS